MGQVTDLGLRRMRDPPGPAGQVAGTATDDTEVERVEVRDLSIA